MSRLDAAPTGDSTKDRPPRATVPTDATTTTVPDLLHLDARLGLDPENVQALLELSFLGREAAKDLDRVSGRRVAGGGLEPRSLRRGSLRPRADPRLLQLRVEGLRYPVNEDFLFQVLSAPPTDSRPSASARTSCASWRTTRRSAPGRAALRRGVEADGDVQDAGPRPATRHPQLPPRRLSPVEADHRPHGRGLRRRELGSTAPRRVGRRDAPDAGLPAHRDLSTYEQHQSRCGCRCRSAATARSRICDPRHPGQREESPLLPPLEAAVEPLPLVLLRLQAVAEGDPRTACWARSSSTWRRLWCRWCRSSDTSRSISRAHGFAQRMKSAVSTCAWPMSPTAPTLRLDRLFNPLCWPPTSRPKPCSVPTPTTSASPSSPDPTRAARPGCSRASG